MDGTGELCVGRNVELPEFSTNHDLVGSILALLAWFHIQDQETYETFIALLIFLKLLLIYSSSTINDFLWANDRMTLCAGFTF